MNDTTYPSNFVAVLPNIELGPDSWANDSWQEIDNICASTVGNAMFIVTSGFGPTSTRNRASGGICTSTTTTNTEMISD